DRRKLDLQPADPVWVYQHFHKSTNPEDVRIKKLAYHWHGPYRIHSRQGDNTYRIYLPTHPDRVVPINVDRLKAFKGHWTRPFNEEIPVGQDDSQKRSSETDDTILTDDLLPSDSFVSRVEFQDGDVALTNSSSLVSRVLDKRQGVASEKDYLVEYADGSQPWVRRSRLADYGSFITD
ncbi:hypothetical protein H310_04253, partial [Aphanomyces invadans]